jgi:hypothetical protein
LEFPLERFDFDPAARLERVVDPPSEIELAAALQESRLAAALGSWAPTLRWELAVDRKLGPSPQAAIDLAALVGSALRIRTGAVLHIPAVADHSWSTMPAIADRRCLVSLVEEVPPSRCAGRSGVATLADLEWIWPRLADLAELMDSARVRLAVDALASHHAEPNPRLAAVRLWAGVDAVLAAGLDQRVRLAAALAAWLEPRGPARRSLYEDVREMEGMRERVVVSEMLSPADLEDHMRDLRVLLRRLLAAVLAARRLPTAADLDAALLV